MAVIQRTTLVEQILDALVEMVKTQEYRVNDLLPTEKELSDRLGVSRNSVREALKTSLAGTLRKFSAFEVPMKSFYEGGKRSAQKR